MEKVCRDSRFPERQHARNYTWWIKRFAARLARRQAKALLEDAPRKRAYRGWSL